MFSLSKRWAGIIERCLMAKVMAPQRGHTTQPDNILLEHDGAGQLPSRLRSNMYRH